MLVGGYAECLLLYNRVFERFNARTHPVIRPENASLAIVRGAIKFGQSPRIIVSHIVRYTYGLGVNFPFIPGKHRECKKFTCDRGPYCAELFDTLVKADQPVEIGKPIERSCVLLFANLTQAEVSIYRSPHKNVEYIDDPGCELLGTIRIAFANPRKGLNLRVLDHINFSATQLRWTVTDSESGKAVVKNVPIDYSSGNVQSASSVSIQVCS